MAITHSTFFRILCRLLVFCLAFQSLHPAALGVPSALQCKVSTDNDGRLAFHFSLSTFHSAHFTFHLGVPPAYGQALDPSLASTPEFDLADPFIKQKALELGKDPVEIFRFMQEEIGYEAYQGSLRGARGTLWSKAGNALDQASLMIALLRASGIKARYVKGTLGTAEAQEVILSMFPPVLRIVGCPPADALKADPANDPKLLADAKEHYWVEYGDSFTPADPTFPDAQIGQTFASKQSDFTEVPDNLRHKVTVRLKAERRVEAAIAFGGQSEVKNVLNETFITATLVGKPLSVGHFVNSKPAGGLAFSTITHTYSPYILIGQNDGNIEDDEILRGDDYQEVITNFPLGNQLLTGVFLEMDVKSPDGKVETHERALVDRIGFAARQNGGTVVIGGGNSDQPAINDLDIVTISIAPSLQHPSIIRDLAATLESKVSQAKDLFTQIKSLDGTTVENQHGDLIQTASALTKISNIHIASLANALFFSTSDVANASLMSFFRTRSYPTSPKILISKVDIRSLNGISTALLSPDIITNRVSTIAMPGQREGVFRAHNASRGLFENEIEKTIADFFSPNEAPIATVLDLFNEAAKQKIPLHTVTHSTQYIVETLDISEEAKLRIKAAVANGHTVIVPSKKSRDFRNPCRWVVRIRSFYGPYHG